MILPHYVEEFPAIETEQSGSLSLGECVSVQELHDKRFAQSLRYLALLPAETSYDLFGEIDLKVFVGHGVLLV
jgi:hypothetical protein